MLSEVSYDTFYDHEAMTVLLHEWAGARPDLLSVESIGRSWQGRDIWLATCTDATTGAAGDKPGFFVEANIHAAELTSSTAALHLLHRLVAAPADDEHVRRLLRTRTVYVVPRLCPDGAEEVISTGGYDGPACGRTRMPSRRRGCTRVTSTGTAGRCSCACPTRPDPGSRARPTRGCWCGATPTRRAATTTGCSSRAACSTTTAPPCRPLPPSAASTWPATSTPTGRTWPGGRARPVRTPGRSPRCTRCWVRSPVAPT